MSDYEVKVSMADSPDATQWLEDRGAVYLDPSKRAWEQSNHITYMAKIWTTLSLDPKSLTQLYPIYTVYTLNDARLAMELKLRFGVR